jgi:hypothetical protein
MDLFFDIIFITPKDPNHVKWYGKLCGKLVKAWTKSPWSHAACGITTPGGYKIFEATLAGVGWSSGDLYDTEPDKMIIRVPVTEEELRVIIEKAESIAGKGYGLDDCLIGGMHDKLYQMFGCMTADQVADWMSEHWDSEKTMDCSAAILTLLRTKYPALLSDHSADQVTPEALEEACKDIINDISRPSPE